MHKYNVGDKVTLEIPDSLSPSNGMVGEVKGLKVFKCGTLHYDVLWSNGGRFFVPWDWIKNEIK